MLGVIQKFSSAQLLNSNILKPPDTHRYVCISGGGDYNMLMFKSFALRIFEWVLRPVDTYLFKVNNKHRTILMDVFPFILCRILKILVGIGKTDNNLCWLIQIQDFLKKRKLLLFLSLFFFTFSFLVFLITIKTFINIFMEIRNNKQPPEVLYEKSAIRNFAKFTGKHPYQSLFS